MGRRVGEVQIWAELAPFLGMREATGVEALAEYIVWQELFVRRWNPNRQGHAVILGRKPLIPRARVLPWRQLYEIGS
jgi:hypothetical protein